MTPVTITVDDFCARFGCKRTKAYQLVATGQLESLTIGRRRLITYRSAIALIEKLAAADAARRVS